jgi:hypothetical protein
MRQFDWDAHRTAPQAEPVLIAESATFAPKAGVWFRRGRLLIVSPHSPGTARPLSGKNSTYRPVQLSFALPAVPDLMGRLALHMRSNMLNRLQQLSKFLDRIGSPEKPEHLNGD